MKRSQLIAVLVGFAAVAALSSPAHAHLYMMRHGSNLYPAVTTPMAPMPSAPVSQMPTPMAGGLVRPHAGLNVYPSVSAPMPHHDGPNLYQYVVSDPIGHTDPMGLSSRKTKYWHVRGYGAQKIKSGFGEVEHSVIAVDLSKTEGVDYGPADKKGGKKSKKKKVSGLAWLLWGKTGKTNPWTIQFELNYSRTSEKWRLCIKDSGTMKGESGGKDIECKCATEGQIKACIERVAKAWNGTTWKRGHDCRQFVQAAESECCLDKCSN